MKVILPCIPDPTDIVLQGAVIGDSSAMDWQLALAKAVPVSDIPALLPVMQGEVIGDYKMTGFPVPRALIGQHPWYGIKPRQVGPMRVGGGEIVMQDIGFPLTLDPYAVFVDRTQAWQATAYSFDKAGLMVTLHQADVIGAEEATDEGVILPGPLFPEDPVVTIPRGAIYRSGLSKRITSVTLPATFGRHTSIDSFTETTDQFIISGVTNTRYGVALPNCRVVLLRTNKIIVSPDQYGNPIVDEKTSDGSGNFTFQVPTNDTYQLYAYLPGSPDVVAVTLDHIVGDATVNIYLRDPEAIDSAGSGMISRSRVVNDK